MEMDRRSFLLLAASPLYAGPLVQLSAAESKLVDALTNQIIPADDAPGASEAGVVFYIDKQLDGPLKRFRPTYTRCIPLFQAACRNAFGREFQNLSFDEQTDFLRQIEHGPDRELSSFFSLVIEHTMQGFYGSPEHGGNRDEASWKMLNIVDVMGGHAH